MHTIESIDQAQIPDGVAPEFFAKTRLTAGDQRNIFCTLCNRLLSAGAVAATDEGFFAFGGSEISIRSSGGGLDIQVFAEDILTLVGIRAMLEGCLHEVPGRPFKCIQWQSEQVSAQSTQAPRR